MLDALRRKTCFLVLDKKKKQMSFCPQGVRVTVSLTFTILSFTIFIFNTGLLSGQLCLAQWNSSDTVRNEQAKMKIHRSLGIKFRECLSAILFIFFQPLLFFKEFTEGLGKIQRLLKPPKGWLKIKLFPKALLFFFLRDDSCRFV